VRVLLDEQLPRQLAPYLAGHDVRTVQQQGWAGLQNGELLTQAAVAGFEIFLTSDQNLEFQQNLKNSRLSIVVLIAVSNAIEDLVAAGHTPPVGTWPQKALIQWALRDREPSIIITALRDINAVSVVVAVTPKMCRPAAEAG